MDRNGVVLFNPRSASAKHRIPNSILQIGASIHRKRPYVFVDGNKEKDPYSVIARYLKTGQFKYFGSSVMPGPQLQQAIPFSKKVRAEFPHVVNVWGGYFASNQPNVVLDSGYVDYVVNGPGDNAFPKLLDALDQGEGVQEIRNLIYLKEGDLHKTKKEELLDQDNLPPFPYDYLDLHYPISDYLGKTFLGKRTLAYHSSFGCPFTCSFCAVVPIYNARWKGRSAEKIYADISKMRAEHGVDSIEFHDNNFFTSRKRVVEFSNLVKNDGISWWGEGRIDTINKYTDDDLALMRDAGCKMIFLGAETGNDDILKQMDKGGTQSADQIRDFAARLGRFDIVPEYSFVLGMPGDSEEQVMAQIESDIRFIQEIKEINPNTEIIIYIYSPVPTEGSQLFEQITQAGFRFPEKLEDWLNPAWENFDLRKNPLTPWLTPKMIDRIKNFETVLNGYHPTVSDFRINGFKRTALRAISSWRYRSGIFAYPYEIRALQKLWKYRRPESEGFYSE